MTSLKDCDTHKKDVLIIANGASCSQGLLDQELKNSPIVVVLDSAMERVNTLGVKVDYLLGDFDRDFDPNTYLSNHKNLQIIHTPDQNFTDLEKAFDFIISKGFSQVRVLWATGRRTDHTINNIANIVRYKHHLKITLLDDYTTIYPLDKDFKKWYKKDSIISLIPITQVSGIFSQNLVYPLKDSCLILGYQNGSSNQVSQDGIVHITHKEGDLILMESIP